MSDSSDVQVYSLTLYVPEVTKKALSKGKWKLCLASLVVDDNNEETYNVVWYGIRDIIYSNTFEFSAIYQVFGTKDFDSGVLVRATTNSIEVAKGQKVVLAPDGFMQEPLGEPDPEEPIRVVNDFQELCYGVTMFNNATRSFSPIFSSPTPYPAGGGVAELRPKLKFQFWFDQHLETAMMYSDVSTKPGKADFSRSGPSQEHTWVPLAGQPLTGAWKKGKLI